MALLSRIRSWNLAPQRAGTGTAQSGNEKAGCGYESDLISNVPTIVRVEERSCTHARSTPVRSPWQSVRTVFWPVIVRQVGFRMARRCGVSDLHEDGSSEVPRRFMLPARSCSPYKVLQSLLTMTLAGNSCKQIRFR